MSASLLQVFEAYQKSRVSFVTAVAEAATRPQNVDVMQHAGVMQLLRPLLLDNVPGIQQTAALALGRLASYSDDLAEAVVANDILPQLVYSLGEQNVRAAARAVLAWRWGRSAGGGTPPRGTTALSLPPRVRSTPLPLPPSPPTHTPSSPRAQRFYKKAAAFVLRHVAKHSPELAQAVVDAGSLEALVLCLEEFDPSVKEAAAWALGYIASHTASLSQAVVDAGALPLLVLCLQEPELSLKRITASALNDVAKHSPELAQAVVDAGAVAYLAPLVGHDDAKLKRQVCSALAQVAKHNVDLAEVVVEAEVFPRMLACLKDIDVFVRKNAATCTREVVKHTPELAKLVVNAGGAAALVDFVRETGGNARLPGIMALGYIAAFSETMALAIIVHKGACAAPRKAATPFRAPPPPPHPPHTHTHTHLRARARAQAWAWSRTR